MADGFAGGVVVVAQPVQLTLEAALHRATDPETSRQAARRAARGMSAGQLAALRALAAHPDGLTDFELAAITGRQQTSIGCRRKDVCRAGLAESTGNTRPSPTGSPATVWRITAAGLDYMRRIERGQ